MSSDLLQVKTDINVADIANRSHISSAHSSK